MHRLRGCGPVNLQRDLQRIVLFPHRGDGQPVEECGKVCRKDSLGDTQPRGLLGLEVYAHGGQTAFHVVVHPHQVVVVRLHKALQRIGILSKKGLVLAIETHLHGVLDPLVVELLDPYHSIGIGIDVGVLVAFDYPLGDIVVLGADNHLGIVLGGHVGGIGRHESRGTAAHKSGDPDDVFVLAEHLLEVLAHLRRLLQRGSCGQVYLDGKAVALGLGHKRQREVEKQKHRQPHREESRPDGGPRMAETEAQQLFVACLQPVEEAVLCPCQHILSPPSVGLYHLLLKPRSQQHGQSQGNAERDADGCGEELDKVGQRPHHGEEEGEEDGTD